MRREERFGTALLAVRAACKECEEESLGGGRETVLRNTENKIFLNVILAAFDLWGLKLGSEYMTALNMQEWRYL